MDDAVRGAGELLLNCPDSLRPVRHGVMTAGIYASCTIVYVRSCRSPDRLDPEIIDDTGQFCSRTTLFFTAPAHRFLSSSWKTRAVQAIAVWKDYLAQGGDDLTDFHQRLLHGEFSRCPIKPATAAFMASVVTRFVAFTEGFRSESLHSRRSDRRFSLLRHLGDERSKPNADWKRRGTEVRSRPVEFPQEAIEPFFRAVAAGSSSRRSALRSSLYFLILAFTGSRMSEPLHLWRSDIEIDSDLKPSVFYYDPQRGVVLPNREDLGDRTGFLQREYGIVPRNALGRADSAWVGWKGMMLDESVGRARRTRAYWSSREAAEMFSRLHVEYTRIVHYSRAYGHPFYFVSLSRGVNGEPWTRQAARDVFKRAASSIGLTSGISMHSFRHAYARALKRRGISSEMLQVCLHHSSPMSQRVYSVPSPMDINVALSNIMSVHMIGLPRDDINFRSDPLGLYGGVGWTSDLMR